MQNETITTQPDQQASQTPQVQPDQVSKYPFPLLQLLDTLLDTDLKKRVAGTGALLFGILYILNPGGGVVELIPDFIPLVGNIDEAAATAIALWGFYVLSQLNRTPEPTIVDQPSSESRLLIDNNYDQSAATQ